MRSETRSSSLVKTAEEEKEEEGRDRERERERERDRTDVHEAILP